MTTARWVDRIPDPALKDESWTPPARGAAWATSPGSKHRPFVSCPTMPSGDLTLAGAAKAALSTDAPGSHITLTLDRVAAAVVVVVTGQAVWLWIVLRGGWYTSADLSNLADATGRPLDWDYLSESAGGHLAVAHRLVYWVLNRLAPLEWSVTVALRVGLQALATVLLWRLMVSLIGRPPWLVVVLTGYAFSPTLLPGIGYLTSAIGLATSQVFVLLMISAHVRYSRTPTMRHVIAAGGWAILALAFATQSAAALAVLPVMSLGILHGGSLTNRLRSAARLWRIWTVYCVSIAAYLVGFSIGDYNRGSAGIGSTAFARVIGTEWFENAATVPIGGPWFWKSITSASIPDADARWAVVLVGQLAFGVLVTLGWRRTGTRVLAAWSIPLTVASASIGLVAIGRYSVLGGSIVPALRYSFFVPLAVALALAASFWPAEPTAPKPDPAWIQMAATIALTVVGVSSSVGFARYSWRGAEQPYVENLINSARYAGTGVNLYDTAVPNAVIPAIEPSNHVSDVLGLAGVDATFDGMHSEPLVVDREGHFVPASFYRAADAAVQTNATCGVHLGGATTLTIPLTRTDLAQGLWYLRLETFQAHPAELDITVIETDGNTVEPVNGSQVELLRGATNLRLQLPRSSPAKVVIVSTSPETTVCFVHTYIGYPFAPEPVQ